MTTVSITLGGVASAQIAIDGKALGTVTGHTTTTIAPGEHVITAQAIDHRSAQVRVQLDPGSRRDITLELAPARKVVNAMHDPFPDE